MTRPPFDLSGFIDDVENILTDQQIDFVARISTLAEETFGDTDARLTALSGGYLIALADAVSKTAKGGRIRTSDTIRVGIWLRRLADIIEEDTAAIDPEARRH